MKMNSGGYLNIRQTAAEIAAKRKKLAQVKLPDNARYKISDPVAPPAQVMKITLSERIMKNLVFSPEAKYEIDFMIKQGDSILNYPRELDNFINQRMTHNPFEMIANGFRNLVVKILEMKG